MKRVFAILILTIFVLSTAAPVFAENNIGTKLKRGVINILSSPLEIPKNIVSHFNEGKEKTKHVYVWIFAGTFKGIGSMVVRAGAGLWDTLTFNIPVPEGFEPVLEPEFVFDDKE